MSATSPYNRTTRDAMASKLFVQVMATAVNLGQLTPEEQAETYDAVADIALLMANRFQARALVTAL